MPLRCASSTSSTGAESVNTRWPNGPICLREPIGKLLQPLAQHLVVVAAARIHRHHRLMRCAQARVFLFAPRRIGVTRQVVHARRDHAHRAGHELGGPRAAHAVPLHVAHAAMETSGQPVAQTGLGLMEIHIGHADL